jgi:hypothetical protein
MGCCLLGLLFAVNYVLPQDVQPPTETASVTSGGTLASWRRTQQRLDRPQAAAIVYPDVAPMAPTAERLQWERQMTFRKPDAPALQARAELPATAAEAITATPAPVKHLAKIPSRPKTVARADRHDQPNYAAAYPPGPAFGGIRQAQYDRPAAGGFFNFRMF